MTLLKQFHLLRSSDTPLKRGVNEMKSPTMSGVHLINTRFQPGAVKRTERRNRFNGFVKDFN